MNSKKRCKFCKEYILADTGFKAPIGFFCSYDHATKFGQEKQLKQRKKTVNDKVKADKKDLRERKLAIKPKSKWLSELQAVFNQYVRLRDAADGCISCSKLSGWHGKFDAGHYYSRGHSSSLRFNLWNVHKQCNPCNVHLSANIIEYTPRLIEKIGQSRFDYLLQHKSDLASYDVDWIKRAIKICRKAVKRELKRAEL